jgi:hypothetical protein
MRYRVLVGLALFVLLAGCGVPMDATAPRASPGQDVLGWEDGYWHNASLDVDNSDGLNETERDALVARAKARVEYVRGLEFEGSVDISVVSRSNFSAGGGGNTSEALRRFDNAKFEALFLVGNEDDSIETQEDSLNRSVAGYYSPARDAIVIVSDSATPTFDSERTLAHELVHALQDQHFDLGNRSNAGSRDAHNGRNGLHEGDPQAVQFAYLDRCGEEWSCIEAPPDESGEDGATDAAGPHLGVYLLEFFPYSDGPGFVSQLRSDGDWARVDDAYDAPPESAIEVIYPERYGSFEPREIDLEDDLRDGWTRVEPPQRPAHARIGQSGLVAMVGYTIYDDYNESGVVSPQDLLNLGPSGVDRTDPIDYDLEAVRGWTGDRLHVYEHGNETAYRWRLTWDSAAAAERFAGTYRSLLGHWGGARTAGEGRWRLPADSPFAGAHVIDVDGDTVTVAAADTTESLADVAPAAR